MINEPNSKTPSQRVSGEIIRANITNLNSPDLDGSLEPGISPPIHHKADEPDFFSVEAGLERREQR